MKKQINKKCKLCYGYGFWPIGDLIPIGEIDSQDWGNKCIQCPFCGKGFVKTGEKYKYLLKQKKIIEKKNEKK